MQRMGHPVELAGAYVLLASNEDPIFQALPFMSMEEPLLIASL